MRDRYTGRFSAARPIPDTSMRTLRLTGRLLFVCLFAALLAGRAGAASPGASPEELTRDYFNALKLMGFGAIAPYTHPVERSRFKAMMLPFYVEEARAGQVELLHMTFGQNATLGEVQAADPYVFMNNFFRSLEQRMPANVQFERIEVLGTVAEGEIMHVLARVTVATEGVTFTKLEVLSLRRYEGEWMVMLAAQYEGLAQALGARRNAR